MTTKTRSGIGRTLNDPAYAAGYRDGRSTKTSALEIVDTMLKEARRRAAEYDKDSVQRLLIEQWEIATLVRVRDRIAQEATR